MSLRLEMLQIARSSPILLRERTADVERFLRERAAGDGGFTSRQGVRDLYYTVFGLEGLLALGADLPPGPTAAWLRTFGDGEGLDLVHLCCLARCRAGLPGGGLAPEARQSLLRRLEAMRRADGGFGHLGASAASTAYGCFLALGAMEDLDAAPTDADALAACVESLKLPDGSYASSRGLPLGTTPTTAAAVATLTALERPVDAQTMAWLLARQVGEGGFEAMPGAPVADLLSTATALHALALAGTPLAGARGPCLRFVEGLWDERGAFRANCLDDELDCEYAWYGLLAMGHLALAGGGATA